VTRILGLDWGSRRIGVAISDDRASLAVGYAVWPAAETEFWPLLESTIKAESVDRLVVGYPLTLRGEVGPKAREVDAFIEKLQERGYRVDRWDERYTTQDASSSLSRLGISQRKQRGRIDMSAAVLLLQSYLDETRSASKDDG
jgi:putative Holliday junction resolvase